MKAKREIKSREVPERKLKAVIELENLIKNNKTFMICSIKNLPGKQFQEIKKKIRDFVKVKVPKKTIVIRAIDNSGIEIKKLKEYIKEDFALLFSNTDLFELSAMLNENKTPIGAKVGQIAPVDIEVEPGATELVPGPIISELGAVGLKIKIEDGKISITEKKIIVKVGQPVNEAAASIMSKLGIKPFSIGFTPLSAYDNQEKKVYNNIQVDKGKVLDDLKAAFGRAIAFAVKMVYPCQDTIGYLLGKAAMHEKAISKLLNAENKVEANAEIKSEDKNNADNQIKSEEVK